MGDRKYFVQNILVVRKKGVVAQTMWHNDPTHMVVMVVSQNSKEE